MAGKLKTRDAFIEDALKVHGHKFDYSLVDYRGSEVRVKIICSKHGVFEQKPHNHLKGQGCPKCRAEQVSKRQQHSLEDFIKAASLKWNNFYDYSKVKYKDSKTKVEIVCPKHGSFWQTPGKHLCVNKCPKCSFSSGEQKILTFLTKHNIIHTTQKKLEGCKNKILLRFDFAVLNEDGSVKFLIEYQGEQHFKPIEHLGGVKQYLELVKRDKIKYNYCKEHNIPLYYITYKDSIEEKLKELPF